ncbi:ribbon-helix-helix domain-containing protein [Hoeflea prorocentri]|uniref:Ribbon-helix-helix domain-containing protein n=1 Tax=Hoeflea prorocentri TaxID=1922333 RepID=A0A9X3ZGP7_9HYPH|nr:ribbon-helix-helix domain-containing protein [Hoeflea prorocentri]MCY6379965.1 ribbon-helix-helix domain-containing protein [Hoeflea prorocentri]MDA5397765.1 ribbon-helix-helix domain-containing protein [Hoeflea prorocentri]
MIRKRSVTIRGHRTSFSLEDEFWQALRAIAADRELSLSNLIVEIDEARRSETNLSSALRVYVLKQLQTRRSE